MANSGRAYYSKNPAANPFLMRRVIAEDPEWNLETVPPLAEIVINHIVKNFHSHPLLLELHPVDQEKVLSRLPTSIPLNITAPLIKDKDYWRRCCQSRWDLCDISEHGNSWKTMFFERNSQEMIEKFVPAQSSLKELEEMLKLSSKFVRRLIITELLPPLQDKPLTQDDDEGDCATDPDDLSAKPKNDHLDCSVILNNLNDLEELQLTYGVRHCGMNFQWSFFEFTRADCQNVGMALKATPTLQVFRLRESKVNNEQGRLLISHLLDHPSLQLLDLSHNCLGSKAGRALGKLLNDHSPKLTVLEISNNKLEAESGSSLGHALQNNCVLKVLKMSLNRLGDLGVQPLLKALSKNSTLVTLDISSNHLGEPSAHSLAEMLMGNHTLTYISFTGNKLGEAGGKLVQEGMEENQTLQTFDLRLTSISQESEYCIEQIIKNNRESVKEEEDSIDGNSASHPRHL